MFLNCDLSELNNYFIHIEWHLSSDYAPLTIIIPISDEVINLCKRAISKDSVEEELFIKVVINSIKNLNISNLLDISSLDNTINNLAKGIDNIWTKNSKLTNITKHSQSWWNDNYSRDLERYRSSKSLEDWKSFHKIIKNTKRSFFNLKITEIANKKWGLWELMS